MQMPKTAFEKVLQKAESIVKRLSVELQCVEHLVQSGELPAAYEMALKAASSAERATLVTRTLPAYTGSPCAKHDVELIISESVCRCRIPTFQTGWNSDHSNNHLSGSYHN